ncbi:VAMP-associated protein [Rhizodiscina lignyota]|uniref:VAMP-associated protein n=1 Tax=Rhizodiscina lignyota TaxID=1504668 RepID=A0A9P4IIX2_9PEZI|nr:VAMP-associated protein [Rhizodiscina lignyota]
MSVELDPQELGFKRPFTQEVSQTLRLKNTHSDPVAFKVKTTAPKQYCVRPNSGKIEAGDTVEVQVLLQAMREDPPLDAKCKDKFLVQSVPIPADKDSGSISTIWQGIEQTNKSSISERKIRVNFLPADGEATSTPKKQVNGVNHAESTPSQASPSMAAFTPTGTDRSETTDRTRKVADTVSGAAAGAAATVQSTARSAAAAVPTSTNELKEQLAAAQRQIEQLKKQLAEQNVLRQRKTETGATTSEKGGLAQQVQQAPAGVPVQIVAALCLICFILAYVLF